MVENKDQKVSIQKWYHQITSLSMKFNSNGDRKWILAITRVILILGKLKSSQHCYLANILHASPHISYTSHL